MVGTHSELKEHCIPTGYYNVACAQKSWHHRVNFAVLGITHVCCSPTTQQNAFSWNLLSFCFIFPSNFNKLQRQYWLLVMQITIQYLQYHKCKSEIKIKYVRYLWDRHLPRKIALSKNNKHFLKIMKFSFFHCNTIIYKITL